MSYYNVDDYFQPMTNEELVQALFEYRESHARTLRLISCWWIPPGSLGRISVCIQSIEKELEKRGLQVIEWVPI